jgi:hypothetical protein
MNEPNVQETRRGFYYVSRYRTTGNNKHPLWVGPFKTQREAQEAAQRERQGIQATLEAVIRKTEPNELDKRWVIVSGGLYIGYNARQSAFNDRLLHPLDNQIVPLHAEQAFT